MATLELIVNLLIAYRWPVVFLFVFLIFRKSLISGVIKIYGDSKNIPTGRG